MSIPKDPVMLLSFVNLKLRDEFSSLEDLCLGLNIEASDLTDKLSMIDYHYDSKTNQFK